MKFIPKYGEFKNSLNEAAFNFNDSLDETKLGQAANIICSFLNKK